MATDRPASARLLAVAPAGRSVASYTTGWDTTVDRLCLRLRVHRRQARELRRNLHQSLADQYRHRVEIRALPAR